MLKAVDSADIDLADTPFSGVKRKKLVQHETPCCMRSTSRPGVAYRRTTTRMNRLVTLSGAPLSLKSPVKKGFVGRAAPGLFRATLRTGPPRLNHGPDRDLLTTAPGLDALFGAASGLTQYRQGNTRPGSVTELAAARPAISADLNSPSEAWLVWPDSFLAPNLKISAAIHCDRT